ncbi:nuclear distribution protein NudE [Trichophyton verrucosum HKI 0517]|uniref:Nuclear distribution protein NudE n=1 Tax=Trichophyton verrucosum (strain HKI 0517) TaxID=663202 RepID=D4DIV7_TRIVH|nr:nuclear distribution protein NudE [Trichophyton verrucosum HKI 0517]EFE38205.1 nuclear distribution protein NudE [Trichophyton verrucosum HKI 0517]
MAVADPPSSPPNASTSTADAIAYYKSQYELLEAELADFQSSSRELEAELEKDIEASEKRERKLKEKVESLGYEVEEWKTKYKQAKSEANSVQSTLQKEITTLRDSNRTLQLKLRDTEVANDDFERQARNTTSSLEDIESKYNISIERGVLLEEEIKNGEQEREMLRIKEQRLRDELADLKVETHIIQEKLRKAEAALERKAKFSLLESTSTNGIGHRLDAADHSPATTTSSPIATPLTKSASSVASEIATPPSPPFSESSTNGAFRGATPNMSRSRVSISESNGVPKHQKSASRSSRHSRVPSVSMSSTTGRITPSAGRQPTSNGLPKSSSLYQIRGLIGKMQKLEERVQSARSRLPAPVDTPPRASPRTGSAMGGPAYNMPSSVTVRSNRKRSSGSVASSSKDNNEMPHTPVTPGARISQGRGSFGLPAPSQSTPSRPESRTRHYTSNSLNMSMANISDNHHHHSHNHNHSHQHHPSVSSTSSGGGLRRPRSSLSNYNPSASMSYIDEDNAEMDLSMHTPTPRRYDSVGSGSSIPTPAVLRRTSGGMSSIPTPAGLTPRRTSSAIGRREGDMAPPSAGRKKASITPRPSSSLGSLGETY